MLIVYQKVPIIFGEGRCENNIYILDLELTLHVWFTNKIDYILIVDNNMFRAVVLSFMQSMLPLIVCIPYL